MLWELSVTEQRYRAVLEVRAGVPVTEVAERYGVSQQSVHAWLRRYRDEGPSGLADRSHKVRQHPWQIPAQVDSVVCELRRAHPKWGPKRLVFEIDRRRHQPSLKAGAGPTASTTCSRRPSVTFMGLTQTSLSGPISSDALPAVGYRSSVWQSAGQARTALSATGAQCSNPARHCLSPA
jgi:transposase